MASPNRLLQILRLYIFVYMYLYVFVCTHTYIYIYMCKYEYVYKTIHIKARGWEQLLDSTDDDEGCVMKQDMR